MEQICDSQLCTGCFACLNACPVQAIEMEERGIGHIHPRIDAAKCIDCKLCQKICPANHPPELNEPQTAYAAWAADEQEHTSSTSGGAAAVLSNTIVAEGGVVYGCTLTGGKVQHVRADKVEDLKQFKGSKYVHSHLEKTLTELKADIKAGRKVLFAGTPCQVAAVKNFVGKADREHLLLTLDLVCHGVPPQHLLFEYLKQKGFKQEDIRLLQFREKKGFFITVDDGRKRYRARNYRDLYYMGFLDNLFFRDCCYTCRYAGRKRVGDITIGDFWGLGAKEPFNHEPNGHVSVVLINTAKGAEYITKCQKADSLKVVERSVDEAVLGNHNLRQTSVGRNKEAFKALYPAKPLYPAIRRCVKFRRLKGLLMPFLPLLSPCTRAMKKIMKRH